MTAEGKKTYITYIQMNFKIYFREDSENIL